MDYICLSRRRTFKTAENMNAITDAGLAEFANVTAVEPAAAKNGTDAISTAIEAYVSGTPANKLLRIVLTVPHQVIP